MEALEAIAHIANAATEDRNTISKLTDLKPNLQSENSDLQSKLVAALEKLASLEMLPASIIYKSARFIQYG